MAKENAEVDAALADIQLLISYASGPDSICRCFVDDLLSCTEAVPEMDVWWLGTAPCRIFEIVGMVVGFFAYESRSVITVDDGSGAVIDCVHRHARMVPSIDTESRASSSTALLPPNTFEIGDTIRCKGKLTKWHRERQMQLDKVELCRSPNEEPQHTLDVIRLHETQYAKPCMISTKPPSIPEPAAPPLPLLLQPPVPPSSEDAPQTTMKPPSEYRPQPVPPSPAKRTDDDPLRLRHPSKLRSKELTGNTFRIYVKYYMDYAPPVILSENASGKQPQTHPSTVFTHGFSVNYLRRVPELHQLAKRVVKAEGERANRELRKLNTSTASVGTAAASMSSAAQKPWISSSSTSSSSTRDSRVRMTRRMKKLFEWAIRALYDEGSIVIFQGPSRVSKISGDMTSSKSMLWRDITNTTATSSRFDSTTATNLSALDGTDAFDDIISDPHPQEECYIPITAAFLEKPIIRAIRSLQARRTTNRGVTTKEVLNYLAKDESWGRLGECTVNDALRDMRGAGKVRKEPGGVWMLPVP